MVDFFEDVAFRSTTIDELLSEEFCALPGEKKDADRAARRLSAWCTSSASGDWRLFEKRLERDGLSISQVLQRFATVRRNPHTPRPLWASDLKWVVAALRHPPPNDLPIDLENIIKRVAFGNLFSKLLIDAEAKIRITNSIRKLVTPRVFGHLGQLLLGRLTDLSAPALYKAFLNYKSSGETNNRCAEENQCGKFELFLSHMRKEGFIELFRGRPVLLRLISSLTRQWIVFVEEFLDRLSRDVCTIRRDLLGDGNTGPVSQIEGNVSDLHNYGCEVLLVTFRSGQRVVYKPKSLEIDRFWNEFVSYLNGNQPPEHLRAPKVVSGEGYGWAEFISHRECASKSELQRFYRRAGSYISLLYIFGGADMHEENIVASGGDPVPVDLELIFLPAEKRDKGAPEREAMKLASLRISESVMKTGLLPSYGRTLDNKVRVRGGLAAQPDDMELELSWVGMNSDNMKPSREKKKKMPSYNTPTFNGEEARASNHLDDLLKGFKAYSIFLIQSRDKVLKEYSHFHRVRMLHVRKVLRPTRFYFLLLERLKDYRNMNDGVEWSSHLDFVSRFSDWDEQDDFYWHLLRSEREALSCLNVPFFYSTNDGAKVADYLGTEAESQDDSGVTRAIERYQEFNSKQIEWQCAVIRLAMSTECRRAKSGDYSQGSCRRSDGRDPSEILHSFAEEVADCLCREAVTSGPGAAWVGLDSLRGAEVHQLAPLGFTLYNGGPGISLFLAAYSRVAGSQEAAALSSAGLAALRFNLKALDSRRFARSVGLGGTSGLGSIVYCLTLIGSILGREELLEEAAAAAHLFSDELIEADRHYDVVGGCAGGILALLKLHETTGDTGALDYAARCGERLLQALSLDSLKEWPSATSGPGTGMAHGAAGIAYALASLRAATGRGEFGVAAQAFVEYENSYFCKQHSSWQDASGEAVSADRRDSWSCRWCHGAGGIGHSRLGILKRWPFDVDLLKADLAKAVECVHLNWPSSIDTLCCGNTGNIELLREVGVFFKNKQMCEEGLNRLVKTIGYSRSNGDFLWDWGEKRYNLGLFRGLAGIGYAALRCLDSRLPNILAFE